MQYGAEVEGWTEAAGIGFSVFEAFSFLLDDGNGCLFGQKAMMTPLTKL